MFLLLLTACGGGSSGDDSTNPVDTSDEDAGTSDDSTDSDTDDDEDADTGEDTDSDESTDDDDDADTDEDTDDGGGTDDDDDTDTDEDTDDEDTAVTDHEDDDDYTWDDGAVVIVTLNGDTAEINGSGAAVDGSVVTISSAGTYQFSGNLSDGMIKVDTADEDTVRLILSGVDITCSYQAPIQVLSAEKTVIVLADGSENDVTDGASYTFDDPEDDEPNAAVFSKDDLTLYGNGNLTVMANYNDGISSKDGLIINCGGTVTIDAVDDGIRGKDYLVVKDGNLVINADGDGLKSDNEEDDGTGYIKIEGGTVDVTTGADAIQAASDIWIADGTFDLTTGGGSSDTVSDSDSSAKGLKATGSLSITSGNFTISSADDCIHSNDTIDIEGGTFLLSSGDDGIHADVEIGIDYADLEITTSYEGIESALITINDGEFIIVSSDDGLNVAGGNDDSGNGGPGGPDDFMPSDSGALYINGGFFAITSVGDGIDANGSIEMTGGTVLVHGPTESGNSAIDYDRSFTISGGLLAAAGSSGMAMGPSSDSDQSYALLTFSTQQADTLIHVESESGASLLTFAPSKAYQSLAFSSPDLTRGQTYSLYFGGASTGAQTYGLCTDGTYSGGSQSGSFTAN
ncbi:hypothetical protein Dvar_27590 [Desulfosarcina variabilis str. Montpellier]